MIFPVCVAKPSCSLLRLPEQLAKPSTIRGGAVRYIIMVFIDIQVYYLLSVANKTGQERGVKTTHRDHAEFMTSLPWLVHDITTRTRPL